MNPDQLTKTSFNGGLLLKEMMRRNIRVTFIGDTGVTSAVYGKHKELLYDVYSSLLSYPEGWIFSDKYYAKQYLMAHDVPVTPGFTRRYNEIDEITRGARRIGYPVVLKPTVGSHGSGVYINIENVRELNEILKNVGENRPGNGYLLIEKYFPSQEYRLFVTTDGFFAAVHRSPASVVGDGKSTILQLIRRENNRRMTPRVNCLCEIALDEITFRYMDKYGITIDDIPKKNKRIYLRANSNVSTGGNCADITDMVHQSVKDFAFHVLRLFPHASYLGIDLLCPDITKKLRPDSFRICELNPAPGLSLHMLPENGKSRNAAGALVDVLFPETKHI